MPTTYIWTGTTSGDFATATNWSPNSPAGGPIAGDTIIFRNSAVNLDATLDQSSKAFAAAMFDETYTGIAGTSAAAPFKFDATTLVVKSGGPVHIKGAYTAALIQMANSGLICDIDSAATTTAIQFKRGCVLINGGTYTTAISTAFNNDPTQLIVINQGGTLTEWDHESGVPRQTSGTTTTYQGSSGILLATGGVVTNAHLRQSAGFDDRTGGAVTLVKIYNRQGSYDASHDARAKTVTTIKAHEGAQVNTTNNAGNITVTNQQNLIGQTVASYGVAAA